MKDPLTSDEPEHATQDSAESDAPRHGRAIPLGIAAGVVAVLVLGGLMVWRARVEGEQGRARRRARSRSRSSRPRRRRSARRARTSARSSPGSRRRSARSSSRPTSTRCSCGRARSVEARRGAGDARLPQRERREPGRRDAGARASTREQKALADEAARVQGLLDGGFVVAERGRAEDGAERGRGGASSLAQKAKLARHARSR